MVAVASLGQVLAACGLPGTRDTAEDRRRLLELCAELSDQVPD